MARFKSVDGEVVPFTPAEEAEADAAEAAALAGLKAKVQGLINAEAGRRINARLPAWQQSNMVARGVELVNIRFDRAWTSDEAAEAAGLQAAWDWIKSVRVASDAIQAAIPEGADAATFQYLDRPEWPADPS
ncbi:MAG TPA: hypothetical protein VFH92_11385 [Phenylobacterium sp.]|nr:hypothetical protein [Phenylobacterium sp.]